MTQSSSFSIDHLNEQQKKAVTYEGSVQLVIAGAGSGKTRVITSRIAHLMLNSQVSAHQIIAVTFTNKAAQEMRERIAHYIGTHRPLPFIGTFHSYCLRLLKINHSLLKVPFASLMDEDDQLKIVQGIITRNNLNKQISPKQALYYISQQKNRLSPDESSDQYDLMQSIAQTYEQEKRISKCLDFDDLLIETLQLFKHNEDFKKQFQRQVRHILVDEYQDTNVVQHELIKQMTLNASGEFAIDSLCVVGDEDQSIYSWRGATVSNILHFKRDFPSTSTITIEQNYRSAQPILDAANHVIKNNPDRNPKKLWSTKSGQNRIKIISCLSDYHEAEVIAHAIKSIRASAPNAQVAVLYRTHFQSRSLEEGLIKHSIGYKIIGGVQFYERKEIKDLLSYLKLIINPHDRASFLRIINVPSRRLGTQFEELVHEEWNKQPFSNFKELLSNMVDEGLITGTKRTAVGGFLSIFSSLVPEMKPSEALNEIIAKTDYRSYLKETCEADDALNRLENIKELLRAISHFEQEKQLSISSLLDDITLMQEQYNTTTHETSNPVVLMTLHAAKGLEFDYVILSGLEEGLLPSSRSLSDPLAIQEERRLLYVGITRAREYLMGTHSRYRYSFGAMNEQRPSRFLKEIPEQLQHPTDCSSMQPYQLTTFFRSWFNGGNAPESSPKVMTFSQPQPKPQATMTGATPIAGGSWKKNQPVRHEVYGIGTIQAIEVKSTDTYLTISFRGGVKKISSGFVKAV